jgi:hypothetical protein
LCKAACGWLKHARDIDRETLGESPRAPAVPQQVLLNMITHAMVQSCLIRTPCEAIEEKQVCHLLKCLPPIDSRQYAASWTPSRTAYAPLAPPAQEPLEAIQVPCLAICQVHICVQLTAICPAFLATSWPAAMTHISASAGGYVLAARRGTISCKELLIPEPPKGRGRGPVPGGLVALFIETSICLLQARGDMRRRLMT